MKASNKLILQLISYSGLALSIIPAMFVFAGMIDKELYFQLITAGMCLWFGSAIFWVKPENLGD